MDATYSEAITKGFPGCFFHATGDLYSDLVWESGTAIPSKETLDTWIAANPNANEDFRITVLALRNRFTSDEKTAIQFFMALLNDPAQAEQTRVAAAILTANVTDTLASQWIDLSRLDTQLGVGGLTQFPNVLVPGTYILTSARATEILTNPIQAHERPPAYMT